MIQLQNKRLMTKLMNQS